MHDNSSEKEKEAPPSKEIATWIVAVGALALTGLIWVMALGHALSHMGSSSGVHTLEPLADAAFEQFGLTQIVYLMPIFVWARVTKRKTVVTGVVIAALLTLLVNSVFWYF